MATNIPIATKVQMATYVPMATKRFKRSKCTEWTKCPTRGFGFMIMGLFSIVSKLGQIKSHWLLMSRIMISSFFNSEKKLTFMNFSFSYQIVWKKSWIIGKKKVRRNKNEKVRKWSKKKNPIKIRNLLKEKKVLDRIK